MTKIALTPKEAAEAVGVSVDAIRAAYRSGLLPVHYLSPQRPVIRVVDLEAWVESAPAEARPA